MERTRMEGPGPAPSGFTLLELLTTTAVLSVVLALGVPSLNSLATRMKSQTALHGVTAALAQARIEAVRRNVPVSLCPSVDGARCSEGLAWEGGWIVFVDAARAGQPAVTSDVLTVSGPMGSPLRMRATSGRRLVRFTPNGWAAGYNVTLRLCTAGPTPEHVASIVVNNAGRVRSERPARTTPCPYTT